MSLFEVACKCHKQSSVKIRKGALFLCRIPPGTAQNSERLGPQICAKQDPDVIMVAREVRRSSCMLCCCRSRLAPKGSCSCFGGSCRC